MVQPCDINCALLLHVFNLLRTDAVPPDLQGSDYTALGTQLMIPLSALLFIVN